MNKAESAIPSTPQQTEVKWQKEHFEVGQVLVNDANDDEVVYMARTKNNPKQIVVTNIREISKKRFQKQSKARRTSPSTESVQWEGPSMAQIQTQLSVLSQLRHKNLAAVWGLFSDERKIYIIQEPATQKINLFESSDMTMDTVTAPFEPEPVFRWNSEVDARNRYALQQKTQENEDQIIERIKRHNAKQEIQDRLVHTLLDYINQLVNLHIFLESPKGGYAVTRGLDIQFRNVRIGVENILLGPDFSAELSSVPTMTLTSLATNYKQERIMTMCPKVYKMTMIPQHVQAQAMRIFVETYAQAKTKAYQPEDIIKFERIIMRHGCPAAGDVWDLGLIAYYLAFKKPAFDLATEIGNVRRNILHALVINPGMETIQDAINLIEYYFAVYVTLVRAHAYRGQIKSIQQRDISLFWTNVGSLPSKLKHIMMECLTPIPTITCWQAIQKLHE